jgi:hypothetical protein
VTSPRGIEVDVVEAVDELAAAAAGAGVAVALADGRAVIRPDATDGRADGDADGGAVVGTGVVVVAEGALLGASVEVRSVAAVRVAASVSFACCESPNTRAPPATIAAPATIRRVLTRPFC